MSKIVKNVPTKVSGYDHANAALVAAQMIIGFLVGVMFLIWLTSVFDFSQRTPPAVVTKTEAGNQKPEGYEDDLLEPGVEEFPEVEKPQLKDALEAVTNAVSSVQAALEKRDGDAAEMGAGSGFGSREGGPGTGDANIVPEHKRWQLEYEADDIDTYAQQIDFFDLTLGAVNLDPADVVFLVNNVSGGAVAQQSTKTAMSTVLRFEHRKARLRRWDGTLARQAGVSLEGRVVVQFYPEPTRQIIREVEATHLQSIGRTLEEVRRTVLKVEKSGNQFEFVVQDMFFNN